ncbi:MAG TPA: transporter [Phnomibacter sp.]|nr:transporter [Phnomibacter sp.]
MKRIFIAAFSMLIASAASAQADSAALEKLRRESGVDPTRVQSRAGYSLLYQDQPGTKATITNRLSLNLGVGRWALQVRTEAVTRTPEVPGQGFQSGFGDLRFNVLNAFFVKGKHALAANAEFYVPTGGTRYGVGYFSVTPAITYSYTIKPSLVLAVQPQYTFDISRDPLYPALSVITIRSFLAKFTESGYFFVIEPRPSFDLENHKNDFVLSPIVGKALGAGFNLIFLAEIAFTENRRNTWGHVYQIGFNKNF